LERARRRRDRRSGRVHGADGARALAAALAGARDRIARLRDRRRAERGAPGRPQDLRPLDDRGAVGRDSGRVRGRSWPRMRRSRYHGAQGLAREVPRPRAPPRLVTASTSPHVREASMIEPQPKEFPVTDAVSAVTARLLDRTGLTPAVLERALGAAMQRRIDYADLYFQQTRYETWTVEDGIVKEGVYSTDQGVGVRCVAGERTGFAYADQLDEAALLDAVEAARGIAATQGQRSEERRVGKECGSRGARETEKKKTEE